MQLRLGLDDPLGEDLRRWHDLLPPAGSGPPIAEHGRLSPIDQLIKSMISSRTYDTVSWPAYFRLRHAFPSVAALSEAPVTAVERVIADVTYPEDKARNLVAALQRIAAETGGHDLDFLGTMTIEDALYWLERMTGVGRKVSASVLNASTLRRRVMIVDTHILRILRCLGVVSANADYRTASDRIGHALPDWSGEALLELHDRLKRLGQTVCTHHVTHCRACPLAQHCPTAAKAAPKALALPHRHRVSAAYDASISAYS